MKKREENPLQGKLFMSAREILATHDPNEPDRFYHGTDISVSRASGGVLRNLGPDPREGQGTYRTSRTDGASNLMNIGPRADADRRAGREVKPYYRGFTDRKERAAPETDDQLWQRKLAESTKSGLTQGIRERGVEMPVMLATETQGRMGKPNIAGGHHRVAVMNNLNPDQLMPVMPVNHVLGAHTEEGKIQAANVKRKKSAL